MVGIGVSRALVFPDCGFRGPENLFFDFYVCVGFCGVFVFSVSCLCFLCCRACDIIVVFWTHYCLPLVKCQSGTNMIRTNLTSQIYYPVLHTLVANLLGS